MLIRFSIYSLEGSISQKYALAENAVLRNCVSRLGIFIAMCRGVKCRMIDAHPHAGRKEFAASINKKADSNSPVSNLDFPGLRAYYSIN